MYLVGGFVRSSCRSLWVRQLVFVSSWFIRSLVSQFSRSFCLLWLSWVLYVYLLVFGRSCVPSLCRSLVVYWFLPFCLQFVRSLGARGVFLYVCMSFVITFIKCFSGSFVLELCSYFSLSIGRDLFRPFVSQFIRQFGFYVFVFTMVLFHQLCMSLVSLVRSVFVSFGFVVVCIISLVTPVLISLVLQWVLNFFMYYVISLVIDFVRSLFSQVVLYFFSQFAISVVHQFFICLATSLCRYLFH